MGVSKTYLTISYKVYETLLILGKKYYLRKTARKCLKQPVEADYKREIWSFYKPYTKVNPIFHAVYKQYTGIRDVRFIPDDLFANKIDRYYNIARKAVVLENKCYFGQLFGNIRQPTCIASRIHGLWFIGQKAVSVGVVDSVLAGKTVVIKKACGSGGGHDVYFVDENESVDKVHSVIANIDDDIIIQEPIDQHQVLAEIHPSSVNSIRVLSLLSENGVKIYSCFLRCGRGTSRIDNASMGGLICGIDNKTGRLKGPAISLLNYSEQYNRHPDTKVLFSSVTVPSWQEILQMVCLAATYLPHSRMVAWDIAVDRTGEPILIEANLNNSLVSAHQLVNGPLFKEDTVEILKEVFGGNKFVR